MAITTVTTRCSECGCVLTADVDYDDIMKKKYQGEGKGQSTFFTIECLRCGYTDTPIPPKPKEL